MKTGPLLAVLVCLLAVVPLVAEAATAQEARPARTPFLIGVDEPALQLAAGAIERACGVAPAFVRSGGSIPIVASLGAKGVPTIVSGFALPEDDIHAPNESYRLESLRLGEAAARELYAALARL